MVVLIIGAIAIELFYNMVKRREMGQPGVAPRVPDLQHTGDGIGVAGYDRQRKLGMREGE